MQRLLLNPAAIATPLAIICVDAFTPQWTDWEGETLQSEVTKLAGGPVPETNLDKLSAIGIVLTTDRFFTDPLVFSNVCEANGGENEPVTFQSFDPPAPDEMAWTVFEAMLNRPLTPDETMEQRFRPDVRRFIRVLLEANGFMLSPKPLDFVKVSSEALAVTEDDLELFQAVWTLQRANGRLVTEYVADRMKLMMQQIMDLKLQVGKTDVLVERLSRALV